MRNAGYSLDQADAERWRTVTAGALRFSREELARRQGAKRVVRVDDLKWESQPQPGLPHAFEQVLAWWLGLEAESVGICASDSHWILPGQPVRPLPGPETGSLPLFVITGTLSNPKPYTECTAALTVQGPVEVRPSRLSRKGYGMPSGQAHTLRDLAISAARDLAAAFKGDPPPAAPAPTAVLEEKQALQAEVTKVWQVLHPSAQELATTGLFPEAVRRSRLVGCLINLIDFPREQAAILPLLPEARSGANWHALPKDAKGNPMEDFAAHFVPSSASGLPSPGQVGYLADAYANFIASETMHLSGTTKYRLVSVPGRPSFPVSDNRLRYDILGASEKLRMQLDPLAERMLWWWRTAPEDARDPRLAEATEALRQALTRRVEADLEAYELPRFAFRNVLTHGLLEDDATASFRRMLFGPEGGIFRRLEKKKIERAEREMVLRDATVLSLLQRLGTASTMPGGMVEESHLAPLREALRQACAPAGDDLDPLRACLAKLAGAQETADAATARQTVTEVFAQVENAAPFLAQEDLLPVFVEHSRALATRLKVAPPALTAATETLLRKTSGPAAKGPLTLAVLNAAEARTEADVLTARLSSEPGLSLVERTSLEAVVRERQLTAEGLLSVPESAQLLVLLEKTGPPEKRLLSLRLFDRRQGLLLGAAVSSPETVDAWVEEATRRVLDCGQRLDRARAGLPRVLVRGFSPRYDPSKRQEQAEGRPFARLVGSLLRESGQFQVLDDTDLEPLAFEDSLVNLAPLQSLRERPVEWLLEGDYLFSASEASSSIRLSSANLTGTATAAPASLHSVRVPGGNEQALAAAIVAEASKQVRLQAPAKGAPLSGQGMTASFSADPNASANEVLRLMQVGQYDEAKRLALGARAATQSFPKEPFLVTPAYAELMKLLPAAAPPTFRRTTAGVSPHIEGLFHKKDPTARFDEIAWAFEPEGPGGLPSPAQIEGATRMSQEILWLVERIKAEPEVEPLPRQWLPRDAFRSAASTLRDKTDVLIEHLLWDLHAERARVKQDPVLTEALNRLLEVQDQIFRADIAWAGAPQSGFRSVLTYGLWSPDPLSVRLQVLLPRPEAWATLSPQLRHKRIDHWYRALDTGRTAIDYIGWSPAEQDEAMLGQLIRALDGGDLVSRLIGMNLGRYRALEEGRDSGEKRSREILARQLALVTEHADALRKQDCLDAMAAAVMGGYWAGDTRPGSETFPLLLSLNERLLGLPNFDGQFTNNLCIGAREYANEKEGEEFLQTLAGQVQAYQARTAQAGTPPWLQGSIANLKNTGIIASPAEGAPQASGISPFQAASHLFKRPFRKADELFLTHCEFNWLNSTNVQCPRVGERYHFLLPRDGLISVFNAAALAYEADIPVPDGVKAVQIVTSNNQLHVLGDDFLHSYDLGTKQWRERHGLEILKKKRSFTATADHLFFQSSDDQGAQKALYAIRLADGGIETLVDPLRRPAQNELETAAYFGLGYKMAPMDDGSLLFAASPPTGTWRWRPETKALAREDSKYLTVQTENEEGWTVVVSTSSKVTGKHSSLLFTVEHLSRDGKRTLLLNSFRDFLESAQYQALRASQDVGNDWETKLRSTTLYAEMLRLPPAVFRLPADWNYDQADRVAPFSEYHFQPVYLPKERSLLFLGPDRTNNAQCAAWLWTEAAPATPGRLLLGLRALQAKKMSGRGASYATMDDNDAFRFFTSAASIGPNLILQSAARLDIVPKAYLFSRFAEAAQGAQPAADEPVAAAPPPIAAPLPDATLASLRAAAYPEALPANAAKAVRLSNYAYTVAPTPGDHPAFLDGKWHFLSPNYRKLHTYTPDPSRFEKDSEQPELLQARTLQSEGGSLIAFGRAFFGHFQPGTRDWRFVSHTDLPGKEAHLMAEGHVFAYAQPDAVGIRPANGLYRIDPATGQAAALCEAGRRPSAHPLDAAGRLHFEGPILPGKAGTVLAAVRAESGPAPQAAPVLRAFPILGGESPPFLGGQVPTHAGWDEETTLLLYEHTLGAARHFVLVGLDRKTGAATVLLNSAADYPSSSQAAIPGAPPLPGDASPWLTWARSLDAPRHRLPKEWNFFPPPDAPRQVAAFADGTLWLLGSDLDPAQHRPLWRWQGAEPLPGLLPIAFNADGQREETDGAPTKVDRHVLRQVSRLQVRGGRLCFSGNTTNGAPHRYQTLWLNDAPVERLAEACRDLRK